ncbi:MAG: hypothetical protein KF773_08325 [Deltaproteobacteria bacterium]|nr:hypothetical protein [Deltaproteobacteria bacterium]MCW5805973.1 hypothetical protein [Deltaproteobacteria bacterium]
MMKKTLFAAATAAALVGCIIKQDAPPSGLARAIPTAEQVSIKLPGGQQRTIGALADWYVATRGVTRTFNGGTAWVLVLVHTIVQFPVTSVDGDVYTWGPFSDALDPAEYKLDVRDVGDGTYTYQLAGRSKIDAAAQGFTVIIDGVADPRNGDLRGNGSFLVDFDAGRRVNPIDSGDARGSVEVKYDLAARHLDLQLMSTDDRGNPVDAYYAYNETADGGGDMVFDIGGDAGGGPELEEITLRSRWLKTGAGRADARIAKGNLPAETPEVTASECWGTTFQRVFYTDSVNFAPTEGSAAECAFATSDLPPAK